MPTLHPPTPAGLMTTIPFERIVLPGMLGVLPDSGHPDGVCDAVAASSAHPQQSIVRSGHCPTNLSNRATNFAFKMWLQFTPAFHSNLNLFQRQLAETSPHDPRCANNSSRFQSPKPTNPALNEPSTSPSMSPGEPMLSVSEPRISALAPQPERHHQPATAL